MRLVLPTTSAMWKSNSLKSLPATEKNNLTGMEDIWSGKAWRKPSECKRCKQLASTWYGKEAHSTHARHQQPSTTSTKENHNTNRSSDKYTYARKSNEANISEMEKANTAAMASMTHTSRKMSKKTYEMQDTAASKLRLGEYVLWGDWKVIGASFSRWLGGYWWWLGVIGVKAAGKNMQKLVVSAFNDLEKFREQETIIILKA